MIGYDIDGILAPDIVFNESMFGEVEEVRTYWMKPLFIPEGEYVLITGRPACDAVNTMRWVDHFFRDNTPQSVYHDNVDPLKPELYKMKVLKDNPSIDIFIESDFETTQFLRRQLKNKCLIIHYATMVRQSINLHQSRHEASK